MDAWGSLLSSPTGPALMGLTAWPVAMPIATFAPIMIAYFVAWWGAGDQSTDKASALLSLPEETFDYIVVGAGSAGSVISRRLAEDGRFSVLLLEAGGEHAPNNEIPALLAYNLHQPYNDWMYQTVPQEFSNRAFVENRSQWARGKMLGGSSNLNFMMYVRGDSEDFNRWGNVTNDPSWNYDGVAPYFKKMEDYNGNWDRNDGVHGTTGPLSVSKYDFDPGLALWLDAAREKGYTVGDYNRPTTNTIFSPLDVSTNNGRRESTWRAYHTDQIPAIKLTVYKYSHVTKINFDANMKAVSVNYLRHGVPKLAKANKEIIVSAGAINSPQLLMLSGIGPRAHLESLGIEVKVDLPVGQNLQDHMGVPIPFIKGPAFNPNEDLTPVAAAEFAAGHGVLASLGGFGGVAFTKGSGGPGWNNIELVQMAINNYDTFADDITRFSKLKPGVLADWFSEAKGQDMRLVIVLNGLPNSRGEILLNSTNPLDHPLINPKYFSDTSDITTIIDGAKIAVDLFQNTQAFNVPMYSKPFPGCENPTLYPFGTDAYFDCLIRSFTFTMWHYSGTCAMGDGTTGVVNPNLTVRGTSGLRVADASVMPFVTNGNTNAPTIMIGEKASAMVLATVPRRIGFIG